MYESKRLSEVFNLANRITFDNSSRIIMISDCHRGDGSWADDFARNQNIYFVALNHYFEDNYTYIELGDGDELWENPSLSDIMLEHDDAFWILSRFIKAGRFYSIFGNHDQVKKNMGFARRRYFKRIYAHNKDYLNLFDGIKIHEGLVLEHKETGGEIFLVHGHQADYLNDRFGWLCGFLVRYVWRPLELLGVNDPTSPAKNMKKTAAVERKLIRWVREENKMLIAGHTHRPVFSEAGEPPYFNTGSCVHPRCITGIEIANGSISLVKWCTKAKPDGTLTIGRDILAGPGKIADYFKKTNQ